MNGFYFEQSSSQSVSKLEKSSQKKVHFEKKAGPGISRRSIFDLYMHGASKEIADSVDGKRGKKDISKEVMRRPKKIKSEMSIFNTNKLKFDKNEGAGLRKSKRNTAFTQKKNYI